MKEWRRKSMLSVKEGESWVGRVQGQTEIPKWTTCLCYRAVGVKDEESRQFVRSIPPSLCCEDPEWSEGDSQDVWSIPLWTVPSL